MGRLIVQESLSADGFAADATGSISFMESFTGGSAEDFARRQLALIEGLGSIVMGARTYEGFSAFWPTDDAADELIAPAFNALDRYVFTRSHTEAPWGSLGDCKVVAGDTGDTIRRIKAESEGDIGCWGSLDLVAELLGLGEVDELRLVIAPSMIGEGRRFGPKAPVQLELVDSGTFDGALVELVYKVSPARLREP
ncbi:dihydrofolate reductase family protein [Sinomonas notoginsengisoli]|uniref:dihydrofolate reductase family protein n=1 Tax=Sinomonas notoginsengisoli TaxID=1457311 RepID=UPI001F33D610|nr:dihydrofolate reductase family protein [Sinomonas notoginsengisoli]